jgi:uncharacterized protein YaaN involved in tellurite resistance
MNETLATPLDLSMFDTSLPAPAGAATALQAAPSQPVAVPEALAPLPRPARLVAIDNLPPEELLSARNAAEKIDFMNSASLMAHGEGVLSGLAGASRSLLSGVRLGDAGEAGEIAAAVLDGIKILRISDLQAEANAGVKRPGLVGKLLGGLGQAKAAFQGFSENRKQFLTLMDQEQAKARRTKADLAVSIQLLEQQDAAIRTALHELKIAIAAGQIALDRGEDELEQKRQHAIATGEPADAAEVQAMRSALANFRSKIGDLREALVGSAMLIPIIAQNRSAAETRMLKISNGMLVVIPRLMAVAAQAVVQVEIRKAADASNRLDEANRQITLLAAKGAHEAATSAARALGGDQRNLDALAQVADETIRTMHEVIEIERDIAQQDAAREQKLVEIRNKLVTGMQGVNAQALLK